MLISVSSSGGSAAVASYRFSKLLLLIACDGGGGGRRRRGGGVGVGVGVGCCRRNVDRLLPGLCSGFFGPVVVSPFSPPPLMTTPYSTTDIPPD